jgi:hypothetical protein
MNPILSHLPRSSSSSLLVFQGQLCRSYAAAPVCPLVIQFLNSYTIFFASYIPSAAITYAYPTPPPRTRYEVGTFLVVKLALQLVEGRGVSR